MVVMHRATCASYLGAFVGSHARDSAGTYIARDSNIARRPDHAGHLSLTGYAPRT